MTNPMIWREMVTQNQEKPVKFFENIFEWGRFNESSGMISAIFQS